MTFNTIWPNGAVSVRANTVTGQQNTAFIQNTLNIDHYFNDATVGSNFNGHHRFVQMPQNLIMSAPADVPVAASMDGVLYLKQASSTNTTIQGFYNSAAGVYQFIPAFLSGSVAITGSYGNVVAVSAHCYGLIYMFTDDDVENMAFGFFKAGPTTVNAYCSTTEFSGSSSADTNLKFGNGAEASGLNIRARSQSGPNGTYLYRIVYWAT